MEDQRTLDLVAMIDEFMSTGGGHMEVTTKENGEIHTRATSSKTVTVTPSLECVPGQNMACGVPTLFEGLDDDTDGN